MTNLVECDDTDDNDDETNTTKASGDKQESRADAGVSARQSCHLAINFEFQFLSSD